MIQLKTNLRLNYAEPELLHINITLIFKHVNVVSIKFLPILHFNVMNLPAACQLTLPIYVTHHYHSQELEY